MARSIKDKVKIQLPCIVELALDGTGSFILQRSMKIEKIILDTYQVNISEPELRLILVALLNLEFGENAWPEQYYHWALQKIGPSELYVMQRMTTELKIVLTPEA